MGLIDQINDAVEREQKYKRVQAAIQGLAGQEAVFDRCWSLADSVEWPSDPRLHRALWLLIDWLEEHCPDGPRAVLLSGTE